MGHGEPAGAGARGHEERPSSGYPAPFDVQGHTVEEGRSRAIETGRPLILIFEKHGCYLCETFARRHLNDPDLRAAFNQFVVVRKHFDRAEQERFQIAGTPLILYYENAGGSLRFADAIKGLREVELVTKRARDVLRGRNRCEAALAQMEEGDKEGSFVVGNYYLPYLDREQRNRFLDARR